MANVNFDEIKRKISDQEKQLDRLAERVFEKLKENLKNRSEEFMKIILEGLIEDRNLKEAMVRSLAQKFKNDLDGNLGKIFMEIIKNPAEKIREEHISAVREVKSKVESQEGEVKKAIEEAKASAS